MSFGGGFGGGGFGQNNTNTGSTFGGFGSNNTNTTSAFGSSATPAFGGANTPGGSSLFGGSSGGGAFGNTGGFGSTTNSAFGAPKPAFGSAATTSSGGGLFGGSSTTATAGTGFGSGGFGSNNTTSTGFGSGGTMFGQAANKPTGFGSTAAPATGTTGGLFGGGGFGSATSANTGFGAASTAVAGPVPDPPGTAVVPFSAYQEKEANGSQNVFQNIAFQEPYKKYSPEELRLVDYAQGRQFGNGTGAAPGAFGAPSSFGGGSAFGNNTQTNTGFGANTGSSLFGGQQSNTNTGFGANNTNTTSSPFGGGNTGGLFGQSKPASTGLFGAPAPAQPAQQSGGLFGNNNASSTTGAFGNTGTGGFGSNATTNNASGGLFGAKPATTGFGGGGFGNTAANNTSTPFGGNATSGAFGSNTASNTATGGLFGQPQAAGTGGLFGQTQQQQAQPSAFGSNTAFGQNNQQQPQGGSLFGNAQKPATGLFGTPAAQSNTGGLFGQTNNNNTTSAFGQTNTQQQPSGGLFGAKPAGTTGSLFGQQPAQQQTGQTGSLFGNLGGNNQPQQQQTSSLFGQTNQQKPSLFGASAQPASNGLFGQQQQQPSSLFGNTTNQQPQQPALGGSVFQSSQNQQSTPQSLTASIGDLNAFGTPSLFAGLGQNDVQNPGPLATPLSSKNKSSRKASVLPMWKLNPGSGTKFTTPAKRGYGFSYSTYGSPVTPSSNGSTPGAFGQSLLGAGNLNRSLSKSFSSTNLRRSINAEDSILSPGSFSASMGPRPYGSQRFNKLTIDKSLRIDLFSPVSKGLRDPNESPTGPRKIAKRVSFDTSNVGTASPATVGSPQSPQASAPDLGYIRGSNGEHVNGSNSRSPSGPPEMEQVGKELPTVHEESSPASARSASTPALTSSNGPGEYWTSPSLKELSKMNRAQLSQVSDFTVGRHGVGYVRFKVPVDLNNVEVERIPGGIVILDTRSCTVYPDDMRKPAMGKGLNVPSEISLLQSWPRNRDKRTGQPIKSGRLLEKHINKLKTNEGTAFVSYDPETGNWVFEVEHFTTYGLFDDDDETDGETLADITVDDVADPSAVKQSRAEEEAIFPAELEEDTFDLRRKRRALPGAFDYTGQVSDDEEEEMTDANQQSFLSNRSADSASQALVHQHEDEEMDAGHALPEDQEPSPYLGYHQAAEQDFDSPYHGSMAEYQETPGGILRARMQAIKGANAPLKIHVADGDDWMDMLQKTITPAKRDRAALKTINEEETYESLKQSTRQLASPAKSKIVPDGRGFATSIELMNSLFEKPKVSAKSAQTTIPTSGFKFPYKRQDQSAHDEDDMDANDTAFHDAMRPNWGPDGTLVLAAAPKVLSRSSKRMVEKDGIMSMSRLNIVSANRDIRFAKFANESSAKALNNQISLTSVKVVDDVPTVSLRPISSLTAFFHGQDLQSPVNAHEKMVWELASILFDHIHDAQGTQVAPSGLRSARRRNLSKFWEGIVEDAVNRSIGMARSPEDKALASLSGHRVPDACKHLIDGKNFRLATLVSLIGTNDQLMSDMKEQVRSWRDSNVLSEFTVPIRAMYELMGGNVCAVDGKKGAMENRMDSFVISDKFGMDWKQAFGLRLWYAIASQDDVVEAICQYEDDLAQDKEKQPKPWFAEQGIQALWEDPDLEKREDLLWGLLKLYADKDTDLADVLRPENSQLSPLDFRLCWQLGQALINTGKVDFGEDASEKIDAATLSFASQLTSEGNWLEAVFVLLHLTNPDARSKAIQEHLSRHARLIGSEGSEDYNTLTQVFKIPATWVWQAKALYQRAVNKDPKLEVLYLLRATAYSEAHKTLIKHVAPQAIIERDYAGLWETLEQIEPAKDLILDWNLGGKIYHDFLTLMLLVHEGKAMNDKVVKTLMQGLPAMREHMQVRGDADVLEVAAVADMANVTAKVVVESTKQGETRLQKVLSLPLTEDAYLKYSNELAFAYYRNVMVGS
ncbi:unnamed protein product [Discula destructiva]